MPTQNSVKPIMLHVFNVHSLCLHVTISAQLQVIDNLLCQLLNCTGIYYICNFAVDWCQRCNICRSWHANCKYISITAPSVHYPSFFPRVPNRGYCGL